MEEKQNVYLVGPMAAGKSTIGKILAKRINLPFYDTDAEIIQCTGVDIALIFELEGEDGFRQRESEKLKQLSELKGAVIATGGGIVLDENNRKVLKSSGRVIYLKCSVGQQLSRTRYDTKRPLLQIENPKAKLEELMEARAPIYEGLADIVVSTDKSNSKFVINSILEELDAGS